MNISAYSIAWPRASGLGQWLINCLHGTAVLTDGREFGSAARLSQEDRIRLGEQLLSSRLFEPHESHDTAVYSCVERIAALLRPWRLGFALDETIQEDIDASRAALIDLRNLVNRKSSSAIVHLWAFEEHALTRLASVVSCLDGLRDWSNVQFVIELDGTAQLTDHNLEVLGTLTEKTVANRVDFILTQEAAQRFGSASAYARRIYEQHSQLSLLGFVPSYTFRATQASASFIVGPLFGAICASGIYPRSLRLTFSETHRQGMDMSCPLYGWDWTLYKTLAASVFASSRHGLFEPLPIGLSDRLRALLTSRNIAAVGDGCPFGARSIILGRGARFVACPVLTALEVAQDSPLYLGNTAEGIVGVKLQALEEHSRSAGAPCRSCPVSPLCGGGCRLRETAALGEAVSRCPPVRDIVSQETHIAEVVHC